MLTKRSAETTLGFWSATLATVFSLSYVIGQIAEWLGWLGSKGGPESSSTPLGIAILLTPSLFLAPAFVVLLVCVHQVTPPAKRVWSLAALAFGIAYLVLISMNYYVQLTLVGPRLARGETAGIESFLFVPFNSFLYAVDILGYSLMSIATLFLVPVFHERALRTLLLGNGLLLPFLALQMYYHPLIWIASLWAVTFPAATWLLALRFTRVQALPPTAVAA